VGQDLSTGAVRISRACFTSHTHPPGVGDSAGADRDGRSLRKERPQAPARQPSLGRLGQPVFWQGAGLSAFIQVKLCLWLWAPAWPLASGARAPLERPIKRARAFIHPHLACVLRAWFSAACASLICDSTAYPPHTDSNQLVATFPVFSMACLFERVSGLHRRRPGAAPRPSSTRLPAPGSGVRTAGDRRSPWGLAGVGGHRHAAGTAARLGRDVSRGCGALPRP